jgi:hypothetical protein
VSRKRSQYNVSEQEHFKRLDVLLKVISDAFYGIEEVIDLLGTEDDIYEAVYKAEEMLEEVKKDILGPHVR